MEWTKSSTKVDNELDGMIRGPKKPSVEIKKKYTLSYETKHVVNLKFKIGVYYIIFCEF